MNAKIRSALLMLLVVCHASPLMASRWSPSLDEPFQQFSDEDETLFWASVKDALDNQPDGGTLSWNNLNTESSGTVTPLTTVEEDGKTCRKTKVVNKTGGNVGEAVFTFCRQDDGTWKVAR